MSAINVARPLHRSENLDATLRRWASPLTDVVWGFDAAMLIETIVALLIAIALRTPGCEVGAWPELIGRLRGGEAPASSRPICVAGLHFVDEWEARRARARNLSETA